MAIRKHALYRLLDNPPGDAARGSCYLTGASGPVVDTGALIYNEGTLVLSVGVIREMAEVAGFNVVDGVSLEVENAEQARLIEKLEAEKAELIDENGTLLKELGNQARKSRA